MAPANLTPQFVKPENPFDTEGSFGSELRIRIIGPLRDAGWAAHFGTLQTALMARRSSARAIDRATLDFSRCTWADPLPLLTLTMALAEFVQNGGIAEVVLPGSDAPDLKARRLLRFLALEGFADQMLNVGICLRNAQANIITSQHIPELSDIDVPLRYADSHCISAWILKMPEDITEALDQIEGNYSPPCE